MSSGKQKFRSKIKKHYRLILRREEDLSEKVSIILTPLNVILLFSSALVLFGFIVLAAFLFTPLSQVLPQSTKGLNVTEQYELLVKIDSLESSLKGMQLKAYNLERIMNGEIPEWPSDNQIDSAANEQNTVDFEGPGSQEQQLREEMENQPEQVSDGGWVQENSGILAFYKPLEGIISDSFNSARRHYAVDLVSENNKVVKATLDGTVVLSGWNPKTGHVVVLQHANDLVSIYKHNSVIFKKEGNFVRAGEAIAVVGNSGELTTGPHLHFEIWQKGRPLDPTNYIVF
jgi:murein DD-endopeptidase MepM/ murein hydrolase activator NlpD